LATQYAKAMGLRTIAVDGGAEEGECCKTLGADIYIDYIRSKDLAYDVKAAPLVGLGSHSALILTANEAVHWWNSIEQGSSKLQSRWFRLSSCLMCLIWCRQKILWHDTLSILLSEN
jgi:hypothetical protein